jgi:UDPglucose 6-dehydrogenase
MNAITETKSVPTKVMSFQEAELAKILVNCFVTMKISFANFVGQLSYAFPEHVSADKILDAVGEDSRIGKLYLRSGLGFAGPCFPRDNRALTAVSRDFGLDAQLSKAVDSINSSIPVETVKRLASQFTHGSLGIVGVAYKKDTTVIEESQTLEIAHLWSEEIGEVLWWDPLVQELPENSQSLTKVESVANLQSCDIIICAFDFKDFLPDDLLNSGKCFVL